MYKQLAAHTKISQNMLMLSSHCYILASRVTCDTKIFNKNALPSMCPYVHLLLKQDLIIKKRCFSKFLSIALQFINLKFISTSASHMMLQNYGMICHWKFELLLHFHVSKGNLKLVCFRILSSLGFLTTEHRWSPW